MSPIAYYQQQQDYHPLKKKKNYNIPWLIVNFAKILRLV